MDLINNRTKDIASMALDGLYERSRAIAANSANVLTPNYQRKEVTFENSLQNVIARENEKENLKIQNSIKYAKNPTQLLKSQTPAQIAFLNQSTNKDFSIDVEDDMATPLSDNGNNVNIETEMMDEAKTGMQYQVIATLLSRSYQQLQTVIRGQNQ